MCGERYNICPSPALLNINMNNEIDYKNSPLHGLSLKNLLTQIVDHYGFEILFAYLNINCFKTNPSIASSIKFLKKTTWACEKVEAFYLYEFKNLPKVSSEQFSLPPRDRIIPLDQTPGEPAELSLEDADQLRLKRVTKAAAYNQDKHTGNRNSHHYRKHNREPLDSAQSPAEEYEDPWAKWR